MKYIIEFILATIIIFFVWNILKRIFFSTFYKSVFPQQNNGTKAETEKEKLKSGNHGLNWDAETVDYEEVKEEEKTK
ncbi:MAG: hypothetical protein QM564_03290 [Bergeyella sp.]